MGNGSSVEDDAPNDVIPEERPAEKEPAGAILEEPKHNEVTLNEQVMFGEVDVSSDEGWQEASSKVRSANTNEHKSRRRRPNHLKVKINHSNFSNARENGQVPGPVQRDQKAALKVSLNDASVVKKSRPQSSQTGTEMGTAHSKRVSLVPPTVTSIASKAFSYKEVAMSPPGTILKPMLQKEESSYGEQNQVRHPESSEGEEGKSNDVEMKSSGEETGKVSEENSTPTAENSDPEIGDMPCLDTQEKPSEVKGSKLSAAARPFNPGTIFQPFNMAGPTNFYDTRASQGMLLEPIEFPPISARVPCGPRSPMYYRATHSSQIKHAIAIMNPDAPEFVPRKAVQVNPEDSYPTIDPTKDTGKADRKSSPEELKDDRSKKGTSDAEKAELARQILLSFIVKSVQNSSDRSNESPRNGKKSGNWQSSSEAIANDSAIIKILHGNEEKVDGGSNDQESSDPDYANKVGDGEGFVVVSKRRRNRQHIANAVGNLYNQQSTVCT